MRMKCNISLPKQMTTDDYVNALHELINTIKSSENKLNNLANATKQFADCCKKIRRTVSKCSKHTYKF